jgi:membrane protein involved in colicin uptake
LEDLELDDADEAGMEVDEPVLTTLEAEPEKEKKKKRKRKSEDMDADDDEDHSHKKVKLSKDEKKALKKAKKEKAKADATAANGDVRTTLLSKVSGFLHSITGGSSKGEKRPIRKKRQERKEEEKGIVTISFCIV